MAERVVKVALPVDLIKRMDQAIVNGGAGLETRAEFIREASESFLAEISYPEAPPEPARTRASGDLVEPPRDTSRRSEREHRPAERNRLPREILDAIPSWELEELRLANLAGTALDPIGPGAVSEAGVVESDGEPLLGLHNRDYPSLWAAVRLARYSQDGLPTFSDFCRRATNAAWFYAAQLGPLEEENRGARLRALFPSNLGKRQAAERGFQAFAIGSISQRPPRQGPIRADGPLFLWRLCQLTREDDELVIGLTGAGRSLLQRLAGISLELPHHPEAATQFLAWVREIAPGEKWGFDRVLAAVAECPNREQLVSLLAAERPDWSSSTASSVAQGYVARSREWGLIEQRLHEGHYRLTEFGETWLRGTASTNTGE